MVFKFCGGSLFKSFVNMFSGIFWKFRHFWYIQISHVLVNLIMNPLLWNVKILSSCSFFQHEQYTNYYCHAGLLYGLLHQPVRVHLEELFNILRGHINSQRERFVKSVWESWILYHQTLVIFVLFQFENAQCIVQKVVMNLLEFIK